MGTETEPEVAPSERVPTPDAVRPSVATPVVSGPTGTVTLLFTDIAGSTELLERLRGEYATLLEDHRALLRAAFTRWKGHEVDTQGDSFFVAFSTAADAVACAVEVQRELAAHVWPQGVSVEVRMGLHTGEPIAAQTGYVGLDVHRAARVGAAAHGGQVLLTQTTRELAADGLPADTDIRDLGEHRLKGIRAPLRIFQLEIAGLPTEFPPLKTLGQEDEPPTPGEPPYRGLQVFDEGDARLFVGREKLTERLVGALADWPLLAIVGASGSGKSSLLRAGVIPALRRDPDYDWEIHLLTPAVHPLDSLATAMTSGATDAAALIDDLRRDARSLRLHVNRTLAGGDPRGGRRRPGARMLIAIDQLEELFTLCRDEEERRAFIDNILTAVDLAAPAVGNGGQPAAGRAARAPSGPLRIVVTLRADFYAHLAEYAGLREAIASHQVYVGPMEHEELRRAIEEPAIRNGWDLVPGLTDLLLHDAGDEPGNLPLLSHALLETWRRRRGTTLTLKGYAESGGVRGAIATTAERVFMRELSEEQQRIARANFLRLTELGQGTQDTRRRVARSELVPKEDPVRAVEVDHVLQVLADARLITVAEETVEVAHEALIREWPRLREWLAQDREGLLLHRRLTEAASEWELLERDPGALYRGARLVQAVEWASAHPDQLNAVERAFVEAGQGQADAERLEREAARQRELDNARALAEAERQRADESRRTNRRLRGLLAVAGVLLLATIGAVALAFVRAADADRAAGEAEQEAARADLAAEDAEGAATVADAQRLGAQALVENDMDLALLLARQGIELAQTPQSEGNLLATLLRSQDLLRVYRPVDGRPQMLGGISANGTLLAVPSNQGETVLMNTQSGEVVETFAGALAFYSADGRFLVIDRRPSSLVLRDRSGQERQIRQLLPADTPHWVLAPNAGEIGGIVHGAEEWTFHRTEDGSVAATLKVNTAGHAFLDLLYPLENRDALVTVEAPFDLEAGDFVPDGEVVFVVRSGPERAPVRSVPSGLPWNAHPAVAVSLDGRFLAMGAQDGKVTLVDLEAATQREIGRHTAAVRGAAFGRDAASNELLVTTGDDRLVRIWHAESGILLDSLAGHAGRVHAPVLARGLRYADIYTSSLDGSVMRWDLTADRRLGTPFDLSPGWFLGDEAPARPAFDEAGLGVAVVTADGTVEIFARLSGWNVEGRIPPAEGEPPNAVAIGNVQAELALQDWRGLGPPVAVAGPAGVAIHTVDGRLTGLRPVASTDAPAGAVTYAPDGTLWAAFDDGSIFAWATEGDPNPISTLAIPVQATADGSLVTSLSVSSDNELLLATHGAAATVWSLAEGSPLFTIPTDSDNFRTFVGVFAPDGETFATGSADGFVRFWDATTGEQVGRDVKASAGYVLNLDYSPDGSTLLTGGGDGTARLIDVESQSEIGVPLPGVDNIPTYAFYQDRRNILVFQSDGSMVHWNADPNSWKQRACAVAGRSLTEDEWELFLPGRPYEPACAP